MEERLGQLESEVKRLGKAVDTLAARLARLEATDPHRSLGVSAPLAEANLRSPVPTGALSLEQLTGAGRLELPGDPGSPDSPGAATSHAPPASAASVEVSTGAALPEPPASASLEPSWVLLTGRSFLVFAGAFLIRALTERDQVPRLAGVAMGLAFALVWVALAWREARLGRTRSAQFFGITSALVSFPLVFEATSRLLVWTPAWAVLVLGVDVLVLFVVAVRYRLATLAHCAVLGALAAGVGLWASTKAGPEVLGFFLVVAALSLWGANAPRWTALRWPVALVLDVAALAQLSAALNQEPAHPRSRLWLVLAAVAATGLLYAAALAHRVFVRARPVRGFEVVQTLLALGVILVCAVEGARAVPALTFAAGALALLLVPLVLWASARLLGKRERPFDSASFGALAFVLVLAGGLLLTRSAWLGVLWAAAALGAVVLTRSLHPALHAVHAAALSFAAALGGGLWGVFRSGLWARGPEGWAEWSLPAALTLVLVAATWVAGLALRAKVPRWAQSLSLAPGLWALTALGAALAYGARWALGADAAAPSWLALARTVALLALGLGSGLWRRLGGPVTLAWTGWALLGLVSLKLALQDLAVGTALTLFVEFLALGLSLIGFQWATRAAKAMVPTEASKGAP